MAEVFLSYDREDSARARSVAQVLEKAGHSVWWDRHIKGGAQYSKEIEEALKRAEAIVVLWSEQSVDSAWVRDEAAAGRDSGRLIPVKLDRSEPPLGFRQYQTIDLPGGRMGRPGREALLGAIAQVAGSAMSAPTKKSVRRPLPRISGWVIAALALAAIAWGYFLVNRGKSDVHTVAIIAADPAAKPLARDLLVNLSGIPSVQAGSIQLLSETGRERPDLTLEARSVESGQAADILVLMSGKDRAILWSKEFSRQSATLADLKQQMAFTAGRILECAMESLDPGGKALRKPTLKLYLMGCSQFAEGNDETVSSAIPVFERVVTEAPRFKAAWAKLLLAQSNVLAGDSDTPKARDVLRKHIVQARQHDPEMPEATLAEVTLLPRWAYEDSLRLLDQARERSPDNAYVLGHRALVLMQVGRTNEAIEDAREAARLDPTSPDAHSSYVLTLAHSGRNESARSEMQRAERQWAGTGRLEELRHAFNLRYGDPKAMLETETFREANPRMQMYYRTRADPTPANIDRFMAFLQDLYSRRGLTAVDVVGHSQAYAELHREDDLYRLIFRLPADADLSPLSGVIFRPSLRKFRHDRRFMLVAKRIGLVDYWTKSGKWPDFCFDPDQPYDCKVEAAKLN